MLSSLIIFYYGLKTIRNTLSKYIHISHNPEESYYFSTFLLCKFLQGIKLYVSVASNIFILQKPLSWKPRSEMFEYPLGL